MALPRRRTRKRRMREVRKRAVLNWLWLLLCLVWSVLVIGAWTVRNSLVGLALLVAGSVAFLVSGNFRTRRRSGRRRVKRAPRAGAHSADRTVTLHRDEDGCQADRRSRREKRFRDAGGRGS